MGKVIHKFQLPDWPSRTEITVPENPRILKVDEQDGVLVLWALVDRDNSDSFITIEIIGTGRPLSDLGKLEMRHHLNTVVMSDGLVWHVFQILKVSPNA